MAIISKDTTRKQVIDLTGPEGNAFYLLGLADKLCDQLGSAVGSKDLIMRSLRAGDYENLIRVFDETFGSIIDLER